MGIQGLLPFLASSTRDAHISEFENKYVAIDAYCWLHKGIYCCSYDLAMKKPTKKYVTYCLRYIEMLHHFKVKPILVFDGRNLSSKAETEKKRREDRQRKYKKGLDLIRAGKNSEGVRLLAESIDIRHEYVINLLQECRNRNIDCIVAPYEADAQLTFFSIQNIVDCVITEDSDLLAYGCERVMFKMDKSGRGKLIEKKNLYLSLGMEPEDFSSEKFLYMCILSGCDYLPSLPSIGLVSALKFVKIMSDKNILEALPKLPVYLNKLKVTVPPEYIIGFKTACNTFLHQLVYNPFIRQQVPLQPVENSDLIVGEKLPDDEAFQLAIGNVDPVTMKTMDSFNPDEDGQGFDLLWGTHLLHGNGVQNNIKNNQSVFDSKKRQREESFPLNDLKKYCISQNLLNGSNTLKKTEDKIPRTGFVFGSVKKEQNISNSNDKSDVLVSRYFKSNVKKHLHSTDKNNKALSKRKGESNEEYLQRLFDETFMDIENEKNDESIEEKKKCTCAKTSDSFCSAGIKCSNYGKRFEQNLTQEINLCINELKNQREIKKETSSQHYLLDEIDKSKEEEEETKEISVESESEKENINGTKMEEGSDSEDFLPRLPVLGLNSSNDSESTECHAESKKEIESMDISIENKLESDSKTPYNKFTSQRSPSPVFKVLKSNSSNKFSKFNCRSADTASTPTSVYFSNSTTESIESSTPKRNRLSQGINRKNSFKKSVTKSSLNQSAPASQTLFQFGFKKGNIK